MTEWLLPYLHPIEPVLFSGWLSVSNWWEVAIMVIVGWLVGRGSSEGGPQ